MDKGARENAISAGETRLQQIMSAAAIRRDTRKRALDRIVFFAFGAGAIALVFIIFPDLPLF